MSDEDDVRLATRAFTPPEDDDDAVWSVDGGDEDISCRRVCVLCTKPSTNRVGDERVNEVLPRTVLTVNGVNGQDSDQLLGMCG